MKELKINPRFEKFSPKKKPDEIETLKDSLKKKGYIGSPILTWHGFIVDGHNRYKICQELGIPIDLDKNVEEIELGEFAEEIDAMDWMLTHQLSSKNLSVGEKLAMTEEFKKEVVKEAKRKQSEAGKLYGNGKTNNSSLVELKINTDKAVAERAGVGTGSVKRYNKVMKSNDEDLKEKVKTGQVTVNKAYEEVRKHESRICKRCGKEKRSIDFFGNDTICKECSHKESEKNINMPKSSSHSKLFSEMDDVYKDVLTAKNAKEHINQDYELNWLKDKCEDFISQVNDKFFDLLMVIEKMDKEHIDETCTILEDFILKVYKIQQKFKIQRKFNYEQKQENYEKQEILESETKYEKIDSSMLHADLSYQNVFDIDRVQLIIDTFTKELLQPLEVSYRNEQYNVIDGKHRLTAIKEIEKITGSKIPVPCWVHRGLTEKEECDLFVQLVKNRRKVSSMEIYKAAYEAGNEFTVNFIDIIRKVGFIFDFEDSPKNGRIHMTTTPHKIFKELGKEKFEDFLTILYSTWNGNKDFLGRDFMNGFYTFYKTYRNNIDTKLFIKRLSILTKEEMDFYVNTCQRKDKIKNIANKIFQKYNKNKRLYPNNLLTEKAFFFMD